MTVSPGWTVTVFGWNARTPVPPTMIRWSEPVGEGSEADVEVGGVDVEAGGVETEELPVPIAFALKASNLLPGFTAKTIPCWQWPDWRQYTQIGSVSRTVSWAAGKGPFKLSAATGML